MNRNDWSTGAENSETTCNLEWIKKQWIKNNFTVSVCKITSPKNMKKNIYPINFGKVKSIGSDYILHLPGFSSEMSTTLDTHVYMIFRKRRGYRIQREFEISMDICFPVKVKLSRRVGPLHPWNGVEWGSSKWPKIDGFHWALFHPDISGVIWAPTYHWFCWLLAHSQWAIQQTIFEGGVTFHLQSCSPSNHVCLLFK